MRNGVRSLNGLVLLVLFVTGCAQPLPVLRLEPITDPQLQHDYRKGWHHVWRSVGDVEIELAFSENAGHTIQFEVRVSNLGREITEIDPAHIYYTALDDPRSSGQAKNQTRWAIDPEQQLLRLDQREAQVLSNYQNADMTDTAVSLIGIIASFSSEEDEVDPGPSWAEQMEANQAQYESSVSVIEVQRYEWSEESLRRTTLYPGETVGGFVRFPAQYKWKFLRVVVPIGELEVPFMFEQWAVTDR